MDKKGMNTLIPYLVALFGSVLAVAANFIPYMEISYYFSSEKMSLFDLIRDSLGNSEQMLGTTEDQIAFGAILAAIIFNLLVVLFVGIKKMVPAIVFTVLTVLPLLLPKTAYIHYIGLAIALIGIIWYMIVVAGQKKNKKEIE